jgi:hypothetical protein
MPDYYASEFFELPPSRRFPEWALGFDVWRELGDGIPETLNTILDKLVRYRVASLWGHVPLKCPRVFISHQRVDETRAREIADLAKIAGYDVWLDVLEPALKFPQSPAPTAQEKSRAVATIVETALLNCTHVLAVMTPNAERSRWVPYEYGRVKDSSLYSLNAACWIDSQLATPTLPEYLQLGQITHSDPEISMWLQNELTTWRARHPDCIGRSAEGDPNVVGPTTADDAPHVVRDKIEAIARAFHEGLPKSIKVRGPLSLRKR